MPCSVGAPYTKTRISVVGLVPHLQRRARMDDDDSARLDVDPLVRLAEQHRQRALERDEDLLLVGIEVPPAARVGRDSATSARATRSCSPLGQPRGVARRPRPRGRAAPPSRGRRGGRRRNPSPATIPSAPCLSRVQSHFRRPSARSASSSARRCASTATHFWRCFHLAFVLGALDGVDLASRRARADVDPLGFRSGLLGCLRVGCDPRPREALVVAGVRRLPCSSSRRSRFSCACTCCPGSSGSRCSVWRSRLPSWSGSGCGQRSAAVGSSRAPTSYTRSRVSSRSASSTSSRATRCS